MRPTEYRTFSIDLSVAGSMALREAFDFLKVVRASAGGLTTSDALVSVTLGSAGAAQDDAIPLTVNGSVEGWSPGCVLSWTAQPGVSATIFLSNSGAKAEAGLRVEAPIANQIVTAAPQRVGASAATVTTAATVTQLLNPAGNTKGNLLRTMFILAGSGDTVTVHAGPAAPSGRADLACPGIAACQASGVFVYPREIFLPAGVGLFVISNPASPCTVQVTYDLS